MNFVFYSEVVGGSLTTSEAHAVVQYFSRREIDQLLIKPTVRGGDWNAATTCRLPLSERRWQG